jgi:hypothetical protein
VAKLTIDQVKERKLQLEKDLRARLKKFEKDTEVFVDYIHIERKMTKGKPKRGEEVYPIERNGPIVNVDVNMRIDL